MALAELEKPARQEKPAPFGPGAVLSEGERQRVVAALNDLSRQLGGASLQQMRAGPIERIAAVAAEVCGVNLRAVRGKQTTSDVVRARFLACLACREHTGATFSEIGQVLGKRDHSSIVYACEQAQQRIASDQSWAGAYAEITRRLGE